MTTQKTQSEETVVAYAPKTEVQPEGITASTRNLNIFIAAKSEGVARVTYSYLKKQHNTLVYEPVVGADVKSATRINALAGVVHTMSLLKAGRGVHTIYTVRMVVDAINNGYFRFWLLTGKNNSGEAIHPIELELWNEFAAYYSELFFCLTIRNIADATVKRSRGTITEDMRLNDKFSRLAWDKVPGMELTEEAEFELGEAQ